MPVPSLLHASRGGVASVSGRGASSSSSSSSSALLVGVSAVRRPSVLARNHAHPDRAMLPDNFGARDPTAGELASNFGDKVLGNWDTEHIIKPPDAIGNFIGLSSRDCQPAASLQRLDEPTLERLRQQVPGWRVSGASSPAAAGAALPCIRREWAARDAAAAEALAAKVRSVAEAAGHPTLAVQAAGATVSAELATPAAGGLTENDFIVASRLNKMEGVEELLAKKRQRFWA